MNLRLIATAVVSAGIGGYAGYKYAERQLVTAFEERLDQETLALRQLYGAVKTNGNNPDQIIFDEMADATDELVEKALKKAPDPVLTVEIPEREPVPYHTIRKSTVQVGEKVEKVITRSVFVPEDNRGDIHVISLQEHEENAGGYQQETLTWYAGDSVLTDSREDRIEDWTNIIGESAVDNFGRYSGDENVVHVRNNVLLVDYEIVRSSGTYVEEVLGEEKPDPLPSGRDG